MSLYRHSGIAACELLLGESPPGRLRDCVALRAKAAWAQRNRPVALGGSTMSMQRLGPFIAVSVLAGLAGDECSGSGAVRGRFCPNGRLRGCTAE